MIDNLKLTFVGDQNVHNFEYKGKTYRPYYVCEPGFSLNDVKQMVTIWKTVFNLNDFMTESIKVGNPKKMYIYACISESEEFFIIPLSSDAVGKINISKYKNITVIKEKESPVISNIYIIETSDKNIAEMMYKRGCTVMQNDNKYLIVEEKELRYVKRFKDDLNFTIKPGEMVKTITGYERLIAVYEKGKQVGVGKLVHSIRNNKSYAFFDIGKENKYYYELWFDDKGKLENTPKHQSNRIYQWNV